jgi:hypothetical protein
MYFNTKSYLKITRNHTTKYILYVKDMICGAFMDKTHLCAIMVAKRLLLRQPLDGDVILISCSSIYFLKFERQRSKTNTLAVNCFSTTLIFKINLVLFQYFP